MPANLQFFSSYSYIWTFKGPEEEKYARYAQKNDFASFRVFTITIMLICAAFLIVDLGRPVNYYWVFIFRFGLFLIYGFMLLALHWRRPSARGLQIVLTLQFVITHLVFIGQTLLANMPGYFLPNVLLLFFYTAMAISGLRFRYALFVNATFFLVFIMLTENRDIAPYRVQYPNLLANLLVSIISGAFIEKQKRKDFMQFSELLRQKESLDELNQQKNRIISILSHDVSSPLRSIDGLLTTYSKSQISKEELDTFLPNIRRQVEKVAFLVYSLVRWSKSQMQGFTVQRAPVLLRPLLQDNFDLVKPAAVEKNIAIEIAVAADLAAFADREMVSLIFRNLLSNAVKFTPPGKRIVVEGKRGQGLVTVAVANEGEPIPAAVREKLFTFQVRPGEGTARESGTGLGLAMSQQFATLNGGRIYLAASGENMNTFCVDLPAVA